MASNAVTEMIRTTDVTRNLQRLRPGCTMGNRDYLAHDECANLLIEETDVMIRLMQALNKAHQENDQDERNVEERYTTWEEVKERRKFPRCGSWSHSHAKGLVSCLAETKTVWKEYYNEVVIDDKLCREDSEHYPRILQYIGDMGWSEVLDRLVELQDEKVDRKTQLTNRLMQTIKTFFLISQQLPPMRRVWERKEEVMPILVNKMLMGPSYILLRQTALVLLLHLVLATKVTADIDWLVEHCGFPEKLLQFAHASDHSKEGKPFLVKLILLTFIAVAELGGDDSRSRLKSLKAGSVLMSIAAKSKGSSLEQARFKELLDVFRKLADDAKPVKYFMRYEKNRRISFRWDFRAPTPYCSYPNCARPPEPGEKFLHCSRCMVTWYCSQECQKQHWTGKESRYEVIRHKGDCVPLMKKKHKPEAAKGDPTKKSADSNKAADTGKDTQTSETSGEKNEKGKKGYSESEIQDMKKTVAEGAAGCGLELERLECLVDEAGQTKGDLLAEAMMKMFPIEGCDETQ